MKLSFCLSHQYVININTGGIIKRRFSKNVGCQASPLAVEEEDLDCVFKIRQSSGSKTFSFDFMCCCMAANFRTKALVCNALYIESLKVNYKKNPISVQTM